jgi:hypothetical protein
MGFKILIINDLYRNLILQVALPFLDTACSLVGQQSGYQSKGILELMSTYACKLSYEETSRLLEHFTGKHVYTASQIQNKVVALEPLLSAHLESMYNNQQLSFNFTETNKDILCNKDAKGICYFDDDDDDDVDVDVTKQKKSNKMEIIKKG